MKAFLVHLTAYVAVNAILLAINASQTPAPGEQKDWWVIWPLAGWGIGIAAHAFAEWSRSHSREGQLLSDEDIRGVAVHLFVYLSVNALLIGINLTYSPDNLWFIWPLLGWGLGLAGHAWLAYGAVTRRTVERYASEQQILTEMKLESQAAEIASAIGQAPKKKTPATRKRRKQAAAKTTRKAAARSGSTAKRMPKKKAAKPARKKP